MPCRYINGNTSDTFGLLRAHGVRIELRNRNRSPASSTRLSFTRGAVTSIGPAAVVTVRGTACPLRTTNRWPCSSRSPASPAMYASTSASSAAANIRRAPSRTISSSAAPISAPPTPSVTTLNIGVPSSPALQRRRISFRFNEEGTSRPRTKRRSTSSGHTSAKGLAQPYRGGARDWLKYRYRDTVDVIVGAVTGTLTRPERLILGLYRDDALQVVGGTSALSGPQQAILAPLLIAATDDHPWPAVI